MSTLILSHLDAGAPTLNGVNGALNAVLDWALLQNGWAIEYTATNARIYRAGTGNRNRLQVRHNSAISGDARCANVRACEGATSTTAITDPFPTIAQQSVLFANWQVSDTVGSAAREYYVLVAPTYFILMVRCNTVASGQWTLDLFGDMPQSDPADVWATMITVKGSAGAPNTLGYQGAAPSIFGGTPLAYWCRDISGSIKSTLANKYCSSNPLGSITSAPLPRAGYSNRIEREKISFTCNGSQSNVVGPTAQIARAWMPNIWAGLHAGVGTLTDADTFTDTAYNAGSLFRCMTTQSTPWFIAELSDTWAIPGY